MTSPAAKSTDPHRWVVFVSVCLVYFFVYFHRVSTSVIVTDLLDAFQTNATALGFMSSMYFYLYAAEQPVVGYLADRIGPRRVIGWWSVAAAAGCLLFGIAPTIGWASAGRALIGLGVGGVYVPAIKALSLWFRREEFTTKLGVLMSVGNVGAVIATTPLAWAAGTLGWRPTFFLIGGITLVLAMYVLFLTHDYRDPGTTKETPSAETTGESPAGVWTNVRRVLVRRQFWIISIVFFGVYGTVVTIQGLWATPYLMSVLGISRIRASQLNMLIPIGVIIGAPFFGWLTDRLELCKRNTVIGIIVGYGLTWVAIIFFHGPLGSVGISAMLLIMGIAAGGFISTLWGLIQETTPPEILGLTSGLLNPAPFLGVAAFQVLTGAILDHAGRIGDIYPVAGFQTAFTTCLIGITACLALSFMIKKST
ncbi:MAG: MFS transporter [Pseudomonadota bacterium]